MHLPGRLGDRTRTSPSSIRIKIVSRAGNLVDDDYLLPNPSILLRKKPLFDLLEPSPMAPISAFTRDPWWYPSYAPYIPSYAQYRTPFYLRDSYLSPVKRNYLWSRHPIRPFGMCLSPPRIT
jgi:hypothetical protein